MTSNKHNARQPILSRWGNRRYGARVIAALLVMLGFGFVHGPNAVHGQGAPTPGVRMANLGAGVQDRRIPESAVTYVGIMGAVKNRGVYSSPEAGIALSDLVERAGGLTAGATRMAHVIRDGRAGLRVFFTPGTSERLLPGDVVVFQGGEGGQPSLSGSSHRAVVFGRRRTGQAASIPDIVHVAFVGLLDRQPVIVKLDGRYATVPQVVQDLRQPPAVAKTVRVIRTDRRSYPVRAGRLPGRLADGDVLVFDRGPMEEDALAKTQTTAQTRFPAAIPMTPEPSADSLLDDQFVAAATAAPMRMRSERRTSAANRGASVGYEPNGRGRANDSDSVGTRNNLVGRLPIVSSASSPIVSPSSFPDSWEHNPIAGRDAVPERGVADLVSSFNARPGNMTAAHVPATEISITEIGVAAVTGFDGAPFLDLAPSVEHLTLASLVGPGGLDINEFLGKAASTHFEPISELPLGLPLVSSVPAPMDPSPTSVESAERGSLAALDTPTIVIGVLALAAMCFAVSIAWTRIDRTAQTLGEPIPVSGQETMNAPSRRQVLERLINNELPMIEEPAQLPDRMDYHGEELGRRRLMLDEPHELLGPHFMAEADVAGTDFAPTSNVVTKTGLSKTAATGASLSPPERAQAALSRFAIADGDASDDSLRRDDPVEPISDSSSEQSMSDHSMSDQQTSGSEVMSDGESSDTETRRPADLQPHSRLLERVLMAMERERRG